MSLPDYITEIKDFLLNKGFPKKIEAVVILGSGLGDFGKQIQNQLVIPYSEIPKFPQSTVQGHSGALIFGEVEGKPTLAFSGRFHFYEGYAFQKTVLPVHIAQAFNADKLLVSNAAGGINLEFRVGDLMVIEDIIKQNMDLKAAPSSKKWALDLYPIADRVQQIAHDAGVTTKRGTYFYVKGPNYETKAEIKAYRMLGGDAVGMSTAPELMEAARLGIRSAAVSLITNAAAGVTDQKLDHAEVKEAAEMKKVEFAELVKGLVREF
ncbi:MAG: purine-nucleoside phosphorylase [Balneola sp.]